MYSKIIRAKNEKIVLSIPKRFVNKDLIINIYPLKKQTNITKFNKYFGIMKIENLEEEINKIRE